MKKLLLPPVLALLALPSLSHAASTVIFTDQGSFLTNLTGTPYVESFNTLSTQPASPISFTSGGFSYQASSSGFYNAGQPAPGDVWLSTNSATDSIVFNFTSGNIHGVGGFFFTTDVNGAAQAGPITVTTNDGTTQTITSSATSTFIGFVSDSPITSLTVAAGQGSGTRWSTVNNFTVGSSSLAAVPEPSALALIAIASAGGAMTRRRRAAGA